MRSRISRRRTRRGFTLIEVVIASGVTMMVLSSIVFFSTFQARSWQEATAVYGSQRPGQTAVELLAPSVRAARSVVVGSSSATRLTLQMPKYDSSGNLVIPLADGDILSFYLSDATGDPARPGSILWRSKNDTPDGTWSIPGGKGRVLLSSGALGFSYFPAASPETVTVTINTSKTIGSKTVTYPTSTEVLLRNKGL